MNHCWACGTPCYSRPPAYCSRACLNLVRILVDATQITPDEYQRLAGRTECDQHRSLERMAPYSGPQDLIPIRVNHSVVGLAGEVGELASLVQKWIYYGKRFGETEPEHWEALRHQFALEFGDALWYIAEGLNALDLSMSAVMKQNIAKLKVRYPDKYTDWHAADENRDRGKEEVMTLANVRSVAPGEDISAYPPPVVLQHVRTGDAVARATELLETPYSELPPLAREYRDKNCSELGVCLEVIMTSFAAYAQAVEGLPCGDDLYKIRPQDAEWFAKHSPSDSEGGVD